MIVTKCPALVDIICSILKKSDIPEIGLNVDE